MTDKEKAGKLKKQEGKGVFCIFAIQAGFLLGFAHIKNPTILPRLYYAIEDPLTTTTMEQLIEEQFGIDYEGTSREESQKLLEGTLQHIYRENPALLASCNKIVLHYGTVENSPFIKPFLNFSGRADPDFRTLELINTPALSYEIVAHELAHLMHYDAPEEFNDELGRIFDDSDYQAAWSNNRFAPINGFVESYGTTNHMENVATYVAASYYPGFWENPSLQQSDKYLRTLSLLQRYDFISRKQFEEIEGKLRKREKLEK